MITALLASGEKLTVVTSEMDWSAERVLEAYKKRWHIERFHKFLEETLGLAHLYSFGQRGIEFPTPTRGITTNATLLASATALIAFLNPMNHDRSQVSGIVDSISD